MVKSAHRERACGLSCTSVCRFAHVLCLSESFMTILVNHHDALSSALLFVCHALHLFTPQLQRLHYYLCFYHCS